MLLAASVKPGQNIKKENALSVVTKHISHWQLTNKLCQNQYLIHPSDFFLLFSKHFFFQVISQFLQLTQILHMDCMTDYIFGNDTLIFRIW